MLEKQIIKNLSLYKHDTLVNDRHDNNFNIVN